MLLFAAQLMRFWPLLVKDHRLCADLTLQGLGTALGLPCPELGVPVITSVPWPRAWSLTCLSSALETPCMAKSCRPEQALPSKHQPFVCLGWALGSSATGAGDWVEGRR